MAAQVIPQSISIFLALRELIRQGYLFGAQVLIRPLMERCVILLYLRDHPEAVSIWQRGWKHNEAPSLAKMCEALHRARGNGGGFRGYHLTDPLNAILHGRPDSAVWSLTSSEFGDLAHAPSKMLSSPELCDNLCDNAIPWVAVTAGMIAAYFSIPDDA